MMLSSRDTVQGLRPFEQSATAPSAEPRAGQKGGRCVRFPQGLPGFPDATQFSLQPFGGDTGLLLLVSMDDPGLRFLVMPHVEGRLPLAAGDIASACTTLGIAPDDVAILLVVSVQLAPGSAASRLTVNLRAPIFVDTLHQVAVQHVLASPAYPIRYPLAA